MAKYLIGNVKGPKGDDGISPIAQVEQTAEGATITIQDASGTTTANITNGRSGNYTAGDNIQINGTVISATDTTYTAGANITIDGNNVISATGGGSGPSYVAGNGIDITGNVISSTVEVPTALSELDNDVDYVDAAYVTTAMAGKQNALTAGDNISISNNTISATDTTYTAGTGLYLSNGAFAADTTVLATKADIAGKQDTLTAGDNITISNGVISAANTTYTAGDGIEIENGEISSTVVVPTAVSQLTNDSNFINQTQLTAGLATKQDTLTAGANITISNGVISATGGGSSYTAGSGISISNDVISLNPQVIEGNGQAYGAHIGNGNTDSGSYGSLVVGTGNTHAGMRSVVIGINNNINDLRNGIVAGANNRTTTTTVGSIIGNNLTQSISGANGLTLMGQYNDTIASNYQFVVGTGTSSAPANGLVLDTSGNLTLLGKATVGTAPVNDMDVATKKYVDDNAGGGSTYTAGDNIDITNNVISLDNPIIKEVLTSEDFGGMTIYYRNKYTLQPGSLGLEAVSGSQTAITSETPSDTYAWYGTENVGFSHMDTTDPTDVFSDYGANYGSQGFSFSYNYDATTQMSESIQFIADPNDGLVVKYSDAEGTENEFQSVISSYYVGVREVHENRDGTYYPTEIGLDSNGILFGNNDGNGNENEARLFLDGKVLKVTINGNTYEVNLTAE